ncbi:MAG: filamentous hemagglutinin N-terminal domain-containing protein [Trichodesmium sp. ALOHA_ZT_67]|nr:filamentous hemagglutinin N-terminal domain-containing protein [Trichodesmium sp. ALOHA_ZT_67]
MDKFRCQPKLSAFVALVFSLSPIVATAQIVPDDSLGRESSVVVPDNIKGIPSERLEGGAIRDGNLFHSFGEFNVGEGQGAYFANPALIENIFTRVTGTNVSNLLGTLGVLGNANLFLINPNGVIFGPNASLDLQGSFVVSSAESFVFNNFEFSASNPQAPPLLTINIPLGLRFQENPGPISARATSELKVGPRQTLGLLGGEVRLDGTVIESPGTQVELGSLAVPGVVELNEDLSFIFPEGAARGDIFLGNEAAINVRSGGGGSITIKAQNVDVVGGSELLAGISEGLGSPEAQGGDIEINATGRINLADNSLIDNEVEENAVGNSGNVKIKTGALSVNNGSIIGTTISGEGTAGSVTIEASDAVVLDGVRDLDILTGVSSSVEEGAEGNGGVITITTGSLEVKNGAEILSINWGKGNAGTVNINATETVVLDGGNSEFSTGIATSLEEGAEGKAGVVTITTGSLEVKNGAIIDSLTLGKGDAGAVNINATETVVLDGENSEFATGVNSDADPGSEGNAGGVTITTGSLEVKNGAVIGAVTFSKGDAGTVNINATETVVLDGGDSEFLTGVTSSVQEGAEGNAGGVRVTTGSMEVKNGAQLLAVTFGKGDAGTVNINTTETVVLDGGDSEFSTVVASSVAPGAEGNAGGVTITTGSLEIKNGIITAASAPKSTGDGGDIYIDSTKVTLTDGSAIAVSSKGQGNGGNIFLSAGDLFLDRGSEVSAITASGQGGNMTFNIANLFSLRNNSPISTTAGGTGNGGNINLSTEFFLARDDSDITANAFEGNGGNISIATQGIFSFPNSTIDASSQLGIDGVIEINTPDIDPSQGLIKLSENVVDPDQLIAQNPCLQGEESEYIITGRGGLSPSPAQTLNSDPLEVGLVEAATGTAATVTPPPPPTSTAQIVPAKGWKLNEKGEVILVSYDPTNTQVQKHRANPATCQPR